MAWRDQLRPASFRGVPFCVDGDDLSAGRRGQVHEYPQRDKPYVEDLGRATRQISITAYVIGPDYMAARDRLLGAIEEGGPGELVHPMYGTMQVAVVGECRVSHSKDEGGMCRFSLSFTEAGELAFPAASTNTAATTGIKARSLRQSSVLDFARLFSLRGMPDFVGDAAKADVDRGVAALRSAAGPAGGTAWTGRAQRMEAQAGTLVQDPAALAESVMDLAAGLAPADQAVSPTAFGASFPMGVPAALPALSRLAAYSPQSPAVAPSTPSRRQQATNAMAIGALFRRAALVQMAHTVAAADWPVYDDAVQVQRTVAAQIDAEASRPEVADPVFRSLSELRIAVVRDIAARAPGSSRLVTITPGAVLPAVVLAYDRYEDAERGEEIVIRNRLRHPGFVPATTLQVLT
ncbi:DNA circularization N-terminal domain-containing protein [Azospirillum sp. SYSU D00513]|uniref:DNA circularization protein n=1 Tax=Azospirillum sp. SYSU D00513 TaxID=2812561 RepID=UPI001FFF3576|nr:DNA circularization N-terminal domain-containing protein [Azospirillum sp. SYSU D00513]